MTTLKTLFIITVSTARFLFPGLPAAPGLPEAAKQPAAKSLSVEVASYQASGADAKASVYVPDGLKISGPVQMQMDNSVLKRKATDSRKFALLEYWGIGREIGANQPKVTNPDGAQAAADSSAEKMPDQSYAYWPLQNSKPLDDAASVAGTYAIKTNFCGDSTVTLGKDQDFLDPINITSTEKDPDLTKPIVIRWKPVANVAGYILKAYGGTDAQTITWTSSSDLDLARGIDYRPLSKEDAEKYIKTGVMIPSYVASCTIPAGVFKGATSVMLVMTAVGKDLIQTKDGTETRVIVRSTASVPLHSALYGPPPKPKNMDRDKDSKDDQ